MLQKSSYSGQLAADRLIKYTPNSMNTISVTNIGSIGRIIQFKTVFITALTRADRIK